jgi:nucleoid DNA-binding protein
MFSQDELQAMLNDKRKKNPSTKRRPDTVVAGDKMAKLVANATGYQIGDTRIILAEFYKQIIEQLQNKNLVELPGIGSLFPTLKGTKETTNFNYHTTGKPEKMLMQPRFNTCFRVSAGLDASIKQLPVSADEIEKILYSKLKTCRHATNQ